MGYALISGASEGIGLALAEKYAAMGYDLILTARNAQRLEEIKERTVREWHRDVLVFPYDLTKNPEELAERILSLDKDIDILINNAGMGISGEFLTHELSREDALLSLNIRAITVLCHFFGNQFKKQGHGKILNISSVGSYMPGPYIATYYASKAYLSSFSVSLSAELKPYGILVCDIHLPRIATSFDSHSGRTGNLSSGHTPKWAAKRIYRASCRRKDRVDIGFSTKMAHCAEKIVPLRIYSHFVTEKLRSS